MGLFKHLLGSNSTPVFSKFTAPAGAPPTRKSIIQNRSNFGVNFGSLFVQERFIFHKFFEFTNETNEYDAIKSYVKSKGVDQTRNDLNSHYSNYATDEDWNWLRSKGVTAVRIPIGYWHVNNGQFTKGTPFNELSGVYKDSWNILKDIITKANQYDIGVLVDLHALPGGANTGEHSGVKLSCAGFWDDLRKNEELALDCLNFISKDLQQFDNIIGLQIVNESVFDNDAKHQKKYYIDAINTIRNNDSNIPIYISDGWWPDQWVKWVNSNEQNFQSLGIVIDVHSYRCFSDSDKQKSPEKIIEDLNGDLLTNLSHQADIIIGEYSNVLDEQSWCKKCNDKTQLVKNYGHKQLELFLQRANTGSFFWCYKFESGNGGEWDFKTQVNEGNIPIRSTKANKIPNENDFNNDLNYELSCHTNYWNQQNPSENYEHWRFKEGFVTGWFDAVEFSKFNGSRIGRRVAWLNSRRLEHLNNRGNSAFLWEWEQGFNKGIEKAEQFLFS